MVRAAVVSVCHGGGPMPVLGDPGHKEIVRTMTKDVPAILKLNTPEAPKAIVIVTAHWESEQPTISNAPQHELLYDYGGFPAEAYKLKYDASGSPQVAQQVYDALKEKGLEPKMDSKRGWDHGVFIPMLLINPSASIPVVQVSVLRSESAPALYRMGEALAKLRDDNIAIIGSGSASFHHLRTWMSGQTSERTFQNHQSEWIKALDEAIAVEDSAVRTLKLSKWRDMPYSYEMHPRGGSEHFSPLLVCAGAGGNGVVKQKTDMLMGARQTTYWWP